MDNITSLDSIPLGYVGYVQLKASVSPVGADGYFAVICYGTSNRRVIIAVATSTTVMYMNTSHKSSASDTSWKGWQLVSNDSEWETLSGVCKYRRKNGIVTVRINATFNLTTDWSNLGTLPSGYRPSEVMYQAGISLGSNVNIAFLITSAGVIQGRLNSGATTGSFSTAATITFPV